MLRLVVFIAVAVVLAGESSFGQAKEKPVSISYKNLIKCFPGLKNEALALKVDLTQLKEDIDRKYVTSQSLLRYRQVVLKDASGQKKRLKLAARPAKKGKYNYTLSLENLDAKGEGSLVELPQAHRINPSQKDLDQYFLNQDMMEDERSYYDTKLNGLSLSFKRNFEKVFELELHDEKNKTRVLCEDQKELGVVCSCFQK